MVSPDHLQQPSAADVDLPADLVRVARDRWFSARASESDIAVAETIWDRAYSSCYRAAYVDTAQRIGEAAKQCRADGRGWVLTSPIERAASEVIGRAHRVPVPVPEFDEDALHYAGEVSPASLEPWRALAETVWNTARVEATIAGAYAAGLYITTHQSVRTGRSVAQTHGIQLDSQPAEPWFHAVLLTANRAVIAPGGVPVTAAQLARQSQAPGAVTNAPDAPVDRTNRAQHGPGDPAAAKPVTRR
ncbi:hypothetical protein AB0M46_28700 [Dactylosporangium sp. NPDC051485]|uniref:hypothetical protein n=1 Tax=Dactylosporangium sp. NPDC051485 TaxID=3154846 RepID=UPI003421E940